MPCIYSSADNTCVYKENGKPKKKPSSELENYVCISPESFEYMLEWSKRYCEVGEKK